MCWPFFLFKIPHCFLVFLLVTRQIYNMEKTLPTYAKLMLLTILFAPTQAWANGLTVQDEITPAFWVALSMAIVTSIVALWSILRRRNALVRANEAEAIIQFSDAVLEEGGMAYFTIHNGKTCYCSPRLRRWLGLSESIISLVALEKLGVETTSDKDLSDTLFNKIMELAENGVNFTSTYNPPNLESIYLVRGAKVRNEVNKGRQFDVVLFSNITELGHGQGSLTEKLSQSLKKQALLTQILDVAPFPVWSRDKDLNIDWVNKPYVTAVEKQDEESVINTQAELISDAKKRPLQAIAKRAVNEQEEQVEKHFVIINGERRSLQVHEVPVDSNELDTVGFAVDITRSEFLDAELNQHKAAHAETLNKLSTPVGIFGPDTTLRFHNNAFQELWQLPPEWLAKEPTHNEFLEALREKRQLPEQADFPAWKKHILSHYIGLLEPTEDTWHLPNGTTLRVVTQPHPIGGVLVLFEDVTDSLALERSYNTLIEVQRETLDNLHEAVAVFGSDGRMKLFNSNYAKLWQINPDFLRTEPHIKDVLANKKELLDNANQDWDALQENFINVTASRELYSGQWVLSNKTVVEFSIVPLPDGASLFTISDETSKARITAALEERNQAMKAADRVKSEFIANMSYELRTPLNSIIGFSEILNLENYGKLNEQQKDYISAILSSSVKLKYLIDDILDLSTIEAGKMELDIEVFDMKKTLKTVLKMSQEAATNKQIEVSIIDSKIKDTVIEGDQKRLTQAIYTIVSDIINQTVDGGSISIALAGDDTSISTIITDTEAKPSNSNDGVAQDIIGFARERRASKSLNLGLSLVESFIKIHGGRLNIEINENETRTITCWIPRKFDNDEAPTDA